MDGIVDIPALPSAPEVFIVSWLDYCNKYGMGYALTDGSVGVHFNDSTSLVLAPDKEFVLFHYLSLSLDLELKAYTILRHVDYISTSPKQRSSILIRRNYTLTTFPEDLTTKIYLLKHFQGFMQERLYNEKPYCFLDHGRVKGMDFVQRYLRMKHVIVFKLSHDVLQVSLFFLEKEEGDRQITNIAMLPVQFLRPHQACSFFERARGDVHQQGVPPPDLVNRAAPSPGPGGRRPQDVGERDQEVEVYQGAAEHHQDHSLHRFWRRSRGGGHGEGR